MPDTKTARGRQVTPTKQDVHNAWERIRNAAEAGNLAANAILIALSDHKLLLHTDSGILNLLGHGGWCNDPDDPREAILNAIRMNDPTSGQLPENQRQPVEGATDAN